MKHCSLQMFWCKERVWDCFYVNGGKAMSLSLHTQNFICFHYKSVQHSIKGACIVASAWICNKLDLSFKPFSKQRWGHKFGQMIWLEERVFETSWNRKEWKPMSIFNPLRNEEGGRMQWFRPELCCLLSCSWVHSSTNPDSISFSVKWDHEVRRSM